MLTKHNFKEVVVNLFDKEEIEEKVFNFEYVQISMSSYGQCWIGGFLNDLPDNYDEIIEDGMTYFILVEEIYNIIK